jgi:hypothetical protein
LWEQSVECELAEETEVKGEKKGKAIPVTGREGP